MQSFAPTSTALSLSLGRRADSSSSPAKDAFREVFQGRLQARINSRQTSSEEAARQPSRPGKSRARDSSLGVGKKRSLSRTGKRPGGSAMAAASSPEALRQPTGVSKALRRDESLGSPSQEALPEKATATGQNEAQPLEAPKAEAGRRLPPVLQEFLNFLQSQPNGALKISPDQAPVVAALLQAAGLPQEEVEHLLAAAMSPDKGLTAADLAAAWQRVQGQTAAPQTLDASKEAPKNGGEGSNLTKNAEEIRRTPDYRNLWERLTVPPSQVPVLRMALARLGGSPEELAKLEEEAQTTGISLNRAWQVLRSSLSSPAASQSASPPQTSPREVFSQAAVMAEEPVTPQQLAEWQQVLTQAGLQPEMLTKLLGEATPTTQQELKTTLLSLSPLKDSNILSGPKPLYLPENMRQQPFFSQAQNQEDLPQFQGNGAGDQHQWGGPEAAASWPSAATGEGVGLGLFFPEIHLASRGTTNPLTGAPLSSLEPGSHLLNPAIRDSLWSQIQSGITANLTPGESQVNIQLNPPELGQIQLNLRLVGQELAVTAMATRPEVAELAGQGVQQLLQSLAQQGLILTQFQVRLQDHAPSQADPVFAGSRGKNGESGGKFPPPSRRRSGEVDRFV